MRQIRDKRMVSFVLGLLILVFLGLINSQASSLGVITIFINIAVRVFSAYFCSNFAKDLNRESNSWAFFGFFLPSVAFITMTFVSQKKSLNEEIANGNVIDENISIEQTKNESSLVDSYYNRANANYLRRDYQNAIMDYSTVIVLNPNDGEVYYKRGLAKIAIDEKESAVIDFKKAFDLGFKVAENALIKYCK